MVTVYIALGSNLLNPAQQLKQALMGLSQLPNTTLEAVSPFYQNPAIGPPQDDFINAVAELQTTLGPQELLHALQHLEQQQGRVRTAERNQARTLDLDIILYGNEQIHEDNLIIPHPRFYERAFVLIPLFDIAPSLILPNGEPLAAYVESLTHPSMEKLV